MIQPKTLLVTGGAGFIGSTFVAQCVERGQKVIVLDALTYAGHRENLDWIAQNPGSWELVKGNICDAELVGSLLRKYHVDAVVNFAAESHVDNSIHSPGAFVETNIRGTYTMLDTARHYWKTLPDAQKSEFRFVQISTDEVYGSLGETGKFSETYPMQPNSPYSASKAAGDHLARAWFHTYGFPAITTNCSNNYGPRQFTEKLIPLMITRALQDAALPVYGDGKNIRDWIHVEDHCQGVYLALTKGKLGETYCFGGNAERTNNEIVKAICESLEELQPSKEKPYASLITYVQDRLGHDLRYAIDDSKAVHELGFVRHYDFAKGLRQTIEWYLANMAWCKAVASENKDQQCVAYRR
ncbi:MAG: dTDP-glucose 4,6-dehydratase [Rickettsiales bacterium]|jgi:dTDP-glucose 4,6-dehydratase|nr:dTDP-glucose 4,6-dehydratase [Rickettsiales bacterium]